jgi:hypothetical protein
MGYVYITKEQRKEIIMEEEEEDRNQVEAALTEE